MTLREALDQGVADEVFAALLAADPSAAGKSDASGRTPVHRALGKATGFKVGDRCSTQNRCPSAAARRRWRCQLGGGAWAGVGGGAPNDPPLKGGGMYTSAIQAKHYRVQQRRGGAQSLGGRVSGVACRRLSELRAACRVRLALGFEKVEGAAGGPLKPGGTGVVEEVNTSSRPYKLMGWWYSEGALLGAEVHAGALIAMVQAHPAAAAARDRKGALPLHIAAFCKSPLEVVHALLAAYQAAAAEKDEKGDLPAFLAARSGAPAVAQLALLAAHPAAASARGSGGQTLLHAVVEGSAPAEAFAAVLGANAAAAAEKDDGGRTPLAMAVPKRTAFQKGDWRVACRRTLLGPIRLQLSSCPSAQPGYCAKPQGWWVLCIDPTPLLGLGFASNNRC